jgi:hypothetical protein
LIPQFAEFPQLVEHLVGARRCRGRGRRLRLGVLGLGVLRLGVLGLGVLRPGVLRFGICRLVLFGPTIRLTTRKRGC